MHELRLFLRFALAEKLGLGRECREVSKSDFTCRVDGMELLVNLTDKKLRVVHEVEGKQVELEAENLTDKRYERTNFRIKNKATNHADLSLELFWN